MKPMMNKIARRLSIGILVVFMPIFLLSSVTEYYTFSNKYYMKQFEKYEISEHTGIENNDLEKITAKLTGYLKDTEDNLIIYAPVNGDEEQIFQSREIFHMVDVKDLFLLLEKLKLISLFLCLVIGMYFIFRRRFKSLFYGMLGAGIGYTVFLVSLGSMMLIDFSKYFTKFHELFFTNDLWLLDPDTDILIQMLPQGFFVDIAVAIIVTTAVLIYGVGAITWVVSRGYDD